MTPPPETTVSIFFLEIQIITTKIVNSKNMKENLLSACVNDDVLIRELKQTDTAVVNRQISIQIQSDGCQGLTEFSWP